jgi:hypothetical protein
MKFHKNMTVKLRCGAEIKGVGVTLSGNPCLGRWTWSEKGRRYLDDKEDDRDIVEVLSKPEPVKCCDVAPVVGMSVALSESGKYWEVRAVEAIEASVGLGLTELRYYVLLRAGERLCFRAWTDLGQWLVEV